MKEPNFFIVGAPKCGTTALHTYISQNSQVFLSRIKEPHYYCTDIPGYPRIESEKQYRNLFHPATEQHRAVGEASVFYLYSQAAIPQILKEHPNAKFIAMVRDPVELLHSLHSQFLYGFCESEASFEKAWHLQQDRAQGRNLPPCCTFPSLLQYASVGMLGEQVERMLNIVPHEQVLIIPFEDFKTSTRDVYVRVLKFLGVDDDGRTEFAPVNQNRRHSWPFLARLLMYPPFPLNKIKDLLKRTFCLYDTAPMTWAYNSLLERSTREPIPPALKAEMDQLFKADQEKLRKLMSPALLRRAA